MCDDRTELENESFLARLRPSRREVGLGTGAALAAILTGCASTSERARNVAERRVVVETPDGQAEAFFVAPESGAAPAVILWPDVAGLRPAYETMATRLARAGYSVLAVNPYYRSSVLPIVTRFEEWRTDEGRQKIAPMRAKLTPDAIGRDGAAFVAWLDEQPEVDRARRIGAIGYCMGGSFTFRTAAAAPARVGAISSFHGGGLVSDEPDSPHLLFARMENAAALVCIAENDDERAPEAKAVLASAAAAADVPAEIEVYPAQHGWCTIDSPVYDEAQAERAWARMLATLADRL